MQTNFFMNYVNARDALEILNYVTVGKREKHESARWEPKKIEFEYENSFLCCYLLFDRLFVMLRNLSCASLRVGSVKSIERI